MCRLTRHSRGGPTACHQAQATERVRPVSVARAWRPTVGLPLSSNVRQHMDTPSPGHYWKTPFIWEPGSPEPPTVSLLRYDSASEPWLR
jgi:hypothetical protein